MKIKTAIQGYYEGKIVTDKDFRTVLKKISKDEFIEFIIDIQARGQFGEFQAMGTYNSEFVELWGEE